MRGFCSLWKAFFVAPAGDLPIQVALQTIKEQTMANQMIYVQFLMCQSTHRLVYDLLLMLLLSLLWLRTCNSGRII